MKNWNVRQEDIDAYLKVCREAAEDDNVFAVFKSLPAYTKILEHTSYKQGLEYFNRIVIGPHLDVHSTNDNYGSPKRFTYEKWVLSPTTLQYVYVLQRLVDLFGSLEDMRIMEIGGGYGGQCKIIHDFCKPKSYDIIDLVGVDKLQQKYLSKLGINDVLTFGGCYSMKYDYDLVISNYALSEVTEPLQSQYVRDILLNSKHGYITCNGPIRAMEELIRKFPSFKISPDIEGERKENFIITW